jgi:hypothetical protein
MPEELPEKRREGIYDPTKDQEAIARRKREEPKSANPKGSRRASIPGYMTLDSKFRDYIHIAAMAYMWEYDSVPVVDEKEDSDWKTLEWSNFKKILIKEIEGRGYNQIQRELIDDYEELTGLKKKILSFIRVSRDGLIRGYHVRIQEHNKQLEDRKPERFTQLQRIKPEGYYIKSKTPGVRGRPVGSFKSPEDRKADKEKRDKFKESMAIEDAVASEIETDFWRRSTLPLEEDGLGLEKPMLLEEWEEMTLAKIKERQSSGESSDLVMEDLPSWAKRRILEKGLSEILIAIESEEPGEFNADLFNIDSNLELDNSYDDDGDEVEI